MATEEYSSKNQTLPNIRELALSGAPLNPNSALDSAVLTAGVIGDVILTPEAKVNYAILNPQPIIEGWKNVALTPGHDAESIAYRELAEHRLVELALTTAAHEQVTGTEDKSDEIAQLQEALHGYYSPSLFRAALRRRIQRLTDLSIRDQGLDMARGLVLDELEGYAVPSPDEETVEIVQPKEATIQAVNEWTKERYAYLYDAIDAIEKDEFDSRDIKQLLDVTIVHTPSLTETGWIAELIDRKKLAITTSSDRRKFLVPVNRKLKKTLAKGTLTHEHGHALRSGQAEIAGNAVGTLGTASNERFEETFEKIIQQCVKGSYDPIAGIDSYIAVGLAVSQGLGIDDVTRILTSINQITKGATLGLDAVTVNKAKTVTEEQIRATFNGLTDVDKGIANRKRIDYLQSANETWSLLDYAVEQEMLNEVMEWLTSAKFNPFVASDRELIESYQPMPKQLQGFFDSLHDKVRA